MQAKWAGLEAGSYIQSLLGQTGKKTWAEVSENDPGRKHSLPRSLCNGKPREINKATVMVHFFSGSLSLYKWGISNHCATGRKCPTHCCCTWARGFTHSGLLEQSSSPNWHSTFPAPLLLDLPFMGTPPVGHPFGEFLAIPTLLPTVHLMSITSRGPTLTPKRSELGVNKDLDRVRRTYPNWSWELGPASNNEGRKIGLQVEVWRVLIWTQLPETASHAQTQTTCPHKLLTSSTAGGYRLPIDWAKAVSGWRLSWKGSMTVTNVWRHDHESVRTEQKCTLLEDHMSFEMWKMTFRTDQLLCIAEATGTKIYTRELEDTTHGISKNLVLSLKQYHAHYYWFY